MSRRASAWLGPAILLSCLAVPVAGVWPLGAASGQVPGPQPKGGDPNQNKSGFDDWNLGERFRDRDYAVGLVVQNNCNIAQTVSIEYPKTLKLKGPATTSVGPHTSVVVNMTLALSTPPVPRPPFAPGAAFNCHLVTDDLTLTHPEAKVVTKKAGGTEIYTCVEWLRIYKVSAFIHEHGAPEPPDPPEGGGRGGRGGKKKPNSTCSLLWNHAEFFPTPGVVHPDACLNEMRADAEQFFGPDLDPIRKRDESAWEWLPKRPDIGHLSSKELLELKALVDKQAGGKK